MKPSQRIKRHILNLYAHDNPESDSKDDIANAATGAEVDSLFEDINSDWGLSDYLNSFREGEHETELPCDWSRHYESKSVAAQLDDGTWVGWTYWYGGGKHGEPEAIDWMSDAYEVEVVERKMVETLVFAKVQR